jgi:flagellar motor component MotA
VSYLQFCLEWWAKGGAVNFVILFSSFFLGIFYFSKKYSKGFTNIMIGVVPLLGLLGTVVGMIQTFNALQNSGTDVQSLAGGISKAMITTSSGLCVAIFGTIFLPLKKTDDSVEVLPNDLTIEQLEDIVKYQNKNLYDRIVDKLPKVSFKKKNNNKLQLQKKTV